ncbi:uncharacterized protein LOC129265164 [Lytechinus pictus]|uniref:uncharacterized protein LOC129265164 n=1 Tax=Lytechinus pictus TaxID=7653 RepID=UPI0030B9E8DC
MDVADNLIVNYFLITEAVAIVSFQFIQSYSSVQSNIDEFTSQLLVDLQTKYSLTSQHIKNIQIVSSPSGRILVTFDIDINTRNNTLIASRDRLDRDLMASNYVFVFTNTTGTQEAFLVDGSSASLTPSFWDGWHQYAPDIFYAVLVALLLFALFSATVYCLIAKQKRAKMKKSVHQENRMTDGHVVGIDNGGYEAEMTQVYKIKNTKASPIPDHPLRQIETSLSVISSSETTEPQSSDQWQAPSSADFQSPTNLQTQELLQIPPSISPSQMHRPLETQTYRLDEITETPGVTESRQGENPLQEPSATTSESPSPYIVRQTVSMYESIHPSRRSSVPKQTPSLSLPRRSQQLDQSPLSVSAKTTESPKPDEKRATLPKANWISSLQGSVRSSILGFSSSTASSRRPSITGPSIYARLLYASYSVPPNKIYDYI